MDEMGEWVSTDNRPLRLWPGVIAVTLQWFLWLVVPVLFPDQAGFGMIGAIACGLIVIIWWLFLSRAPWVERVAVLGLMVAAVWATRTLVHPSIANGMMGMMPAIYSIPALSLALVVAAVITRARPAGMRRAALLTTIALACGSLMLLRTDGITGTGVSDLHWRWTPTAEQRLLAQAAPLPVPAAAAPEPPPAQPAPTTPVASTIERPATASAGAPAVTSGPTLATSTATAPPETRIAEWPGFRGPARDAAVHAVTIDTDWSRTPPVEIWRRPVGPGWSSFSVSGDLIFTQEQRGEEELVSCYRLDTGAPVWAHTDPVRFYESNGGAGPRATPTIHGNRVYSLGATGIVNALEAATGRLVWSRNAAAETGMPIPGWGFAGSPLVIDDLVIIAVSGQLVAYDAATGAPRWQGPTRGGGYSSPHLVTLGGTRHVVLLSGGGAMGVTPADGTLLWEHAWEAGVSIVQPGMIDGDLLLSGGDMMGGIGMRRLAISRGANGWTAESRWSTRGLKPYFNDFVVHEGHAYGFDGTILAAIDLADGTRNWKGGRYGAGQAVLLAEQDLLLVVSEEGALALVSATPDKFTEVARVDALEGKTWNHPAVVGNVVLVRNGEEMAAFRLPRRQ
jgi:outer membrane protein assembly factor BamB